MNSRVIGLLFDVDTGQHVQCYQHCFLLGTWTCTSRNARAPSRDYLDEEEAPLNGRSSETKRMHRGKRGALQRLHRQRERDKRARRRATMRRAAEERTKRHGGL